MSLKFSDGCLGCSFGGLVLWALVPFFANVLSPSTIDLVQADLITGAKYFALASLSAYAAEKLFDARLKQ